MKNQRNLDKSTSALITEFVPPGEDDLELLISLVKDFYLYDGHTFDYGRVKSSLIQLLNNPSLGFIRLIKAEGETCGYYIVCFGFSIEFGGRDAYIDELFLKDEMRGRGIGTIAIASMEEHCRREGVKVLHLEVERSNTPAQEFYRRVGYEDHDRYLLSKLLTLP